MSIVGILIALGLLVWLAYRGWSILLLAPLCALVAALMAGQPLLANWTQTFMGNAAGFVAQFFPIFLLGALFGKLMEASGSVEAIAKYLTERLGTSRAMLAIVLAGAFVTYGGVSLFVAFFVLAPMGHALFKAANIPHRLMPAAIALGTSTFTMSAMPGTPAIQNAIPMPFFGTNPFAAPGLGLTASAIMLGFGLWWLARAEARARRAGEAYNYAAPTDPASAAADGIVRERATTAREFDPEEIARGARAATLPPFVLAALPLITVVSVNLNHVLRDSSKYRRLLPKRRGVGRDLARRCRRRLVGHCCAGGGDRGVDGNQSQPLANLTGDDGRGGKRRGAADYQCGKPGRVRRRGGIVARLRSSEGLGPRHRRRAAGLACCGDQYSCRTNRLGIGWLDHCP